MKKRTKLLLVLVATLCLCLGFGVFAACKKDDSGKKHVHDYSEWAYNGTEHWKVCPVDDAEQEGTREEHTIVDGKCECGYQEAPPAHVHTYTELQSDVTYHWLECPVDNDYVDRFGHIYRDGKCIVCQKEGTAPEGELDTRKWYVAGSGAGDLNGVGWDTLSTLKQFAKMVTLDATGNTVYTIELELYSGDEFKFVQDLDWDEGLGYYGFSSLANGANDFKDAGSGGNITPLAGHDGVYEFYIRTTPEGGATANMVEYRLVEHLDPLDITAQYDMYIIGAIGALGSNWQETTDKMQKMELQPDGVTFRGEIKLTTADKFKVYNLVTDNYYPTGTNNDLFVTQEALYVVTWKVGDAMPKVEEWKHIHDFSSYNHDDTNHWGVCLDDGVEDKENPVAHDFGDDAYCDVCGYEKADKPECAKHTWTTENVCSVCGRHWRYTENLTYKITSDHKGYIVTGYDSDKLPADLTEIVVPYYYKGLPVTEIGSSAFLYADRTNTKFQQIRSVVLPDSITKIGGNAFKALSLKKIDIGDGVKTIGAAAFQNIKTLTAIDLPETVTSIGKEAFSGCLLLYSLKIPAGLTTIEEKTFYGTRVVELTIPAGVTFIGKDAFGGCTSLTKLEFETGSKLKEIDQLAFEGTEKLETIELPEGLETIGAQCFGMIQGTTTARCGLKQITIPASVKSIGVMGFWGAQSLESFAFADPEGWLYTQSGEQIVLGGEMMSDPAAFAAWMVSLRTKQPKMAKVETPHTHEFKVRFTETEHWQRCSICLALKEPVSKHTYDLQGYCTVCDFKHEHTYADTWTTDKEGHWHAATCGCDLKKDYAAHTLNASTYKCTTCDYQHTHTYGNTYEYDDTNHWRVATCHPTVKYNETAHSYLSGRDTCRYCGYERVLQGDDNGTPNLMFKINDEYTGAIVTGFSEYPEDLATFTEIVIPEKVGKWDVVEIAADAFINTSQYGAPDKWKKFDNITKVVIPNTVTRIGNNAFKGFPALADLTLPTGQLRLVGTYAFSGSLVTSVTLKAQIIGDYAFQNCTNLTTANITANEIGKEAFSGCAQLSTLTLGEGLETLSTSVFKGLAISTVTLPASLKTLSNSTFEGCTELATVNFGGVVTLGTGVFKGCTSLEKIALPAGITELPESTFEGCEKLTQVTGFENYTSIGKNGFKGCKLFTFTSLPAKLNTFGDSAFEGCEAITSIKLPDSIKTIGQNVFKDCINLKTIDLGTKISKLGTGMFQGCLAFESFTLPAQVVAVPASLLAGCTNITTVTLHENVESIGGSAFKGLEKITKIDIPTKVTSIGASAFQNCKLLDGVKLPAGVKTIANYLFDGCAALSAIEIPADVTSIGNYAFRGCAKLTQITVPDKVTSIGTNAFQNCTLLATVKLGAALTTIDKLAFDGCTSLTSIEIPAKVNTISVTAFRNTGLTSVTFATTTGWFIATSKTGTSGTSVASTKTSDAAEAAKLLKDNTETTSKYYRRK